MQQLTGLDQMFLSLDSPTTNAVLGGVVMFDAPRDGQPVPDEPFMRQRLTERLEFIPPLHMRLVKVPLGIDHSYLADAGRIDVAAHLRTLMLPHPGTKEQLAEEISRIMSTAMDLERPMWDYTVIEGLEGGGIAHVLRIHHGVIDGSTMPVLWDLLADEPVAGLEHPSRTSWPEPLGGRAELLVRGVINTWARPVRMAALQARTLWYLAGRVRGEGVTAVPALAGQLLPGRAGRPIANLVNRRRRATGGPEVTPYLPTLVPPRTPLGGRLSHRRHFVYSDLPLAEFKQLGKAFGTTLNNVVVAVCAGAVRKHLQDMDALPDKPLVVCVPVSLREGEVSEPWANHVHMMFAPLPTHLADPVERLRAVTEDTTRAKQSFDALPKHLLRDGSRFIPRDLFTVPVHAWVRAPHRLARVPWNLVVSNVRGPSQPAFMNGLRVAGYCPASFMSVGGGVNITLQSYVDRIWFGLIGAPEQTGDLWRLAAHMDDALRELQAVAPSSAPALAAPAPALAAPAPALAAPASASAAPAPALAAPAPVELRPASRVPRKPAKRPVDVAKQGERAGHDAEQR